jgi:hypothetical protein
LTSRHSSASHHVHANLKRQGVPRLSAARAHLRRASVLLTFAIETTLRQRGFTKPPAVPNCADPRAGSLLGPVKMDDPDPEPSSAFTVLKQKLEFDFNFPTRSIKGKATLQVLPQDRKARVIQLNCRQLNITSVRVEGCDATKDICYANLYERLSLYPTTGIYQHHLVKMRLQQHASGARAELEITLPDAVKVRTMRPDEVVTYQDLFANGYSADGDMFKPLSVEIEYTLDNPRDAIHFVGVEDGDARYPHVLTRNSPFAGMASCLFPCTDDGTSKCLFEVSVRYPRTLGHVFGKARSSAVGADASLRADDSPKADSVMSDVDDDPAEFTEEEKALEMSVVCSGEMTDDVGSLYGAFPLLLTAPDLRSYRSHSKNCQLYLYSPCTTSAYWYCHWAVPTR